MFESAELGHQLDKATFERELPGLREELLKAQYEVLDKRTFPIVLVVGGVEGAGKGETVSALSEWLDPRHLQVHAMGPASDEERERPPMWRYWRRLPPKGKIGVFFGSWYTEPIVSHALGKSSDGRFAQSLGEIRRFEQMLAAEGALILKFWFHLGKKAQRKRLDTLWSDKHNRFRVEKEDWKRLAHYDDFRASSARALTETDAPEAPWLIIDGSEARYRHFNTAKALAEAMKRRLASDSVAESAPARAAELVETVERLPLVRSLDLTRRLEKTEYEAQLEKYQRRLTLLTRKRGFAKLSPVLVFEGMDAAGKGGAIRRVTRALDARLYDVHPIAAPSDEEKSQPYLWRFWRHAPRDGKFAIFDRSWYGRVLVERVEGFASEPTWMRAYGEINDFEQQLVQAGNVLAKFWLQISPEEQLRRFHEREGTPFKRFKLGPEDWRNREKWPEYERAASDMIEHTSTEFAPWTLVEAEDKYFARIKILRTLCEAIERTL
ncbi:MAG TPA: polyphosphate:AMP phosphotransferase [Polyangiaceae bacterium]|nr:polyphosphate:AMP phosphotransferase [Polyangiaceae bacterium]